MFAKASAIKYALYAARHNKFLFKLGDWVCWHMRKERIQSRQKLHPRGEGLLQTFARINDNFYKLAFHDEHVNPTFNVSNFSSFDGGVVDLRTNPLKSGGMMKTY